MPMKILLLLGLPLAALAAILVAVAVMDNQESGSAPGGLQIVDEVVGNGPVAKAGDKVVVHYTGRLKNGMKFDSSVDRNEPFEFRLGVGQVIKGWDQGVAGMKVGGKRKLIIPPALGYGERGSGRTIPPNSELHFDVELLGIK